MEKVLIILEQEMKRQQHHILSGLKDYTDYRVACSALDTYARVIKVIRDEMKVDEDDDFP